MKLSIVIPTKNRQFYCIAAIRQILSLKLEETEIIIQDNSDDQSLCETFANEISKGLIKYNYVSGVISFVDNFSAPIPLCTGDYVCMIGDDDGILPNIIDLVDTAKENEYDAIIPGLNSVYIWPSDHPIIKGAEKGYLCLAYMKNNTHEVDLDKGMTQLLNNGGQEYQSCDLPRLYHGIVKRTILEEIKAKTGTYFKGLTPDIYMAVALALTCKKVLSVEYPITVSGICPKSGSSDSATGRHTGDLKDAPHFRGHDRYDWDPKAPAIYSVESIWGETALRALKEFGREDLYAKFNVAELDSICLYKYPQFKEVICNHIEEYGYNALCLKKDRRIKNAKRLVRKVLKRLTRGAHDVCKFYEVPDIDSAVNITFNNLSKIIIK